MPEDALDQFINAMLAGEQPAADPELAPLAQIVARLRDLPDEGFQKRLKSDLQRRATMPASTVTPVREGFHTITPFIAVPNAPELIDFLKRTFDAQETSRHPHGEGFMASVKVDDTDLLIMGNPSLAGQQRIGAFHVYVPDCDATYNRALEAGATSLGAPSDHSYGERAGYVKDTAGNQWYIATHLGATPALENLWNVSPFAHPSSVRKYIDFLTRVMGAKELAVHEHGGKVMYAAAQIGDAVLEMGESPNPLPSGFYLFVEDCDAVYQRALEAGATSLWPPADQQYGDRTAGLVDPFGYQWIAATRIKGGAG
ncbi:MAG TPA: VOC family protein [Bryobacteraceae bacterium]|jgi:PhnB protein|nr:VOC family protein [Bryobacteraceae bacterium]